VEQTFRSAVMNDLKIIPCAAGLGFPDEPGFGSTGWRSVRSRRRSAIKKDQRGEEGFPLVCPIPRMEASTLRHNVGGIAVNGQDHIQCQSCLVELH